MIAPRIPVKRRIKRRHDEERQMHRGRFVSEGMSLGRIARVSAVALASLISAGSLDAQQPGHPRHSRGA